MGDHQCLLLLLFLHLPPAQGITWYLSVHTGDVYAGGTDSNIYLELYGISGSVSQHLGSGSFERGSTDQFTYDYNIGEIFSIVIEKDGAGFFEEWYLSWIALVDSRTGKKYMFSCECWVNWYSDPITIYSQQSVCYDIDHCVLGAKQCGGGFGDFVTSICHNCEDPFYSGGWYGGCKLCSDIDHCVDRYCSTGLDQQCRTCEYNNVLYKPSYTASSCEDMCSYSSRFCWPGHCADGYASYCYCASGFYVYSDTWQTTCQLNNTPTIETCHTEAEGPNLEKKRSGNSGPTNECQYETDFYGNFMPVIMHYKLFGSFVIDRGAFPAKPHYIDSYGFGITDVTIATVLTTMEGIENALEYSYPLSDTSGSVNAIHTTSHEGTVTVPASSLNNGDRLCLQYFVYGGGFLTAIDTLQAHRPRLPPTAYHKTHTQRAVCYHFDDTPPQHCLETSFCSSEPLKLEKRISKSPEFHVEFQGWLDPIPPGGSAEHASSVETYQITVNEVSGTNTMLKVGTEVVFSNKVDITENDMRVTVPGEDPRLFCVTLEVKDFADNVRQSRRFFLYDNSTFITARQDKEFYISSAYASSDYQWHSPNDDICLDWRDHFYNPFYKDNNLLAQIEPDPHGHITGVYEQLSGVLPVSGTPNVYGILKYMFSYSKNNENFSSEIEVSNFLDQKLCSTLDLHDGDTYALRIRPIDIADNSYSEDRLVHIDGSAPYISNLGLEKDSLRQLYVHDEIDLSEMDFQVDAYDPHSGIHTVEWSFGITGYGDAVVNGTLAVYNINETECSDAEDCYCPAVGDCEIMKYSIPLHGLVAIHKHIGNHNRNYYFTIKATNKAMLTSTETMDILVDDSPPETGVVLEGLDGYYDIDFTSDETFSVNLHGFIDHESGVRLYRIGLAKGCLSSKEVYYMNDSMTDATFKEVYYPENTVQFSANFTGKQHVTVIALNNAMDPSKPVCSDGISRDTLPPEFLDITIKNARWAESIYCFGNKTWFLRSDLVKLILPGTPSCSLLCSLQNRRPLIEAIPSRFNDTDVAESLVRETFMPREAADGRNTSKMSDFLCSEFPSYDSKSVIYLRNDYIQLSWNVSDDFSQIKDFYVGFGESLEEETSPGLIDYLSTNKKYFYKINHAGIGTDKEFYIFLKAVNKAGIETVITIGPMLVDQTPPRFKYIPDVNIVGDDIVVGWENDTFFDDEQTAEIHRISFQIENANEVASPLIEWCKETASQCPEFAGGCIKYPLSDLQEQDTDLALKFYVKLHVQNIAGHVLTVTTEEFTLPSLYPPTHAVVTDLDPSDGTDMSILQDDLVDVDAHFSINTVCAIWTGFHHHEDIQLEFGIGFSQGLSDVHTFTRLNYTNGYCLTAAYIPNDVKIYISLRATSSAGSTISSSDGIMIYDISQVFNHLNVYDGPECFIPVHLLANITCISNESFEFNRSLVIGKMYTLSVFSQKIPLINATTQGSDIYLKKMITTSEKHDLIFQPYIENPKFFLANVDNGSIVAELYDCVDDIAASADKNSLLAHWSGLDDHFTYEAAVVTLRCPEVSDSSCLEYHSPFSAVKEHKWIKQETHLQLQSTYYTGVRACLNSECSSTKLSSGVRIVSNTFTVDIMKAESSITNMNCLSLFLQWTSSTHADISFYQWSVATKVGISTTKSTLRQWRTVLNSETYQLYVQVQECLFLPVHSFKQLFVCVRALNDVGQKAESCKEIHDMSDQNLFQSTVYEFDISVTSWDDIRTIIRSKYIGDTLRILHEADLDFGTEGSDVVAAVLNGHDRNITWYLTTAREIPTTCDGTLDCQATKLTTDGYVNFPKDKIKYNTVYFICAAADKIELLDTLTGTLPAIQACSDGFVIDNVPPIAGEIHVPNVNGFINNLDEFAVTWSGFDDNIDVSLLGYENKIRSFTIEIGSTPTRRDVKHYADFGGTASLLIEDLMVNSGTSLFVSVIATDYAGLQTRISSDKLVTDITPPTVGRIVLRSTALWISDNVLSVNLMDFADKQSGIEKYITHIGSSQYRMDILSESEHTTEVIDLNLHGTHVLDGHFYYLGVKARNRAGLYSDYIFIQFGVDLSPPTGGHVMDGGFGTNNKDSDFQIDINYISGHWKNFKDPHSGIAYYAAGVGTEPLTYDIEPKINVGLRTEMIWNSSFVAGQKFFVSIEACNHAGICHVDSSDGIILDDSPPIAGIVEVGANGFHHTYIPQNTSLEIFWTGFEDPQTGMQRYEACLGTMPNECDVVPTFDCLLSMSHIKTGIDMPLNENLFVTVTGYNNNNQSVSKTSNYFLVDTTPPKLVTVPKFVANFSASDSIYVQTETSVIKMMWKFSDTESPIVKHIVTLATHHEGHTPIEHIELGNIDHLTINLDGQNWLHNGDTYNVVVTSCNAAGLCLTATSDDLLIDSTPPHMGGFKPQMTWQNFLNVDNKVLREVNLTWYGFYDHESRIKKFYIGVGNSFTGNELTNGLVEIKPDIEANEYNRLMVIEIPNNSEIVISVVAENNAGLVSTFARITSLTLVSSATSVSETAYGLLEIQKHSCDIHFCNKDCTCAVIGTVCSEVQTNLTCSDLTASLSNSVKVHIYGGLSDNPFHITASSSCLSAHWVVSKETSIIKRFEWTSALKNEDYGEGVFGTDERPWMDVGKFRFGVYCLPLNRSLVHGAEYIIYVKAWVEIESYLIFQSQPILIDQTPPAIRKGKFVKDSDTTCTSEYDLINWTDKISACWNDVFYEAEGSIVYYIVGLGTQPGYDDIVSQRNVQLSTMFSAEELNLSPGRRYYFTVTAYNNVGLHTTVSSDGFIVDVDKPVGGIVYNTLKYKNYGFHSNRFGFHLSWSGFLDHDSGIKHYLVAIVEDIENHTIVMNTINVSLETSVNLINLTLENGKRYFGAVKAVDVAGHESDIIYSQSKLVDTTGPTAFKCADTNLIFALKNDTSMTGVIVMPVNIKPNAMYTVSGSLSQTVRLPQIKLMIDTKVGKNLPLASTHEGHIEFSYSFDPSFEGPYNVTLQTEPSSAEIIAVNLTECKVTVVEETEGALIVKQISEDSFRAGIYVIDPESGIKRTKLGIGTTPKGYQLQPLHFTDVNTDEIFTVSVSHRTPIYATAIVENFAGVQTVFLSKQVLTDHTPPVLQDILIENQPVMNTTFMNASGLSGDETLLRLKVSWNAMDEESGIKSCYVSIGSRSYLEDKQEYHLAVNGREMVTDDLNIIHGETIYANVKCVNNIQLTTVKASGPIVASVKPSNHDKAKLAFIPSSVFMTAHPEVSVQSNRSYLQFSWEGFKDNSGISGYEYRVYRISPKTGHDTAWVGPIIKDFVSFNTFGMEDGQTYVGEVRAINPGSLRSGLVNSTLFIDGKEPQMTGLSIIINKNGGTITLNWENVFSKIPDIHLQYDVTVGSSQGFNDILDKASLISDSVSFLMPATTILTEDVNELFIFVSAVHPTGLRTTYTTTYRIPG